MSEIENTTGRMKDHAEKLLFLAEGMADPSAPILRQERDGQRQLVNSDRLPADIRGDRAEWEALGFTFGDPDPGDPMFMPATLPPGWKREGSDHAMWSYLLDQHGRRRASIFYKAAFYDRRAFMRLESLDSYVANHVEYDGPLVITDEWATPETVTAALARGRQDALAKAEECRGYGDSDTCRKHVTQYTEAAAKYAALLDVNRS
jgi:hypothetical protein